MALTINITAAFDVEVDEEELEEIGRCIDGALDNLRGLGAARVDNSTYTPGLTLDKFMDQSSGLSKFEFTIPAPTKRTITFD
jgi:hypothetical protein